MDSTKIKQLKAIAPNLQRNQELDFLLSVAEDLTPGKIPGGNNTDDKLMNYGYHLGYEQAIRTIKNLINEPDSFGATVPELLATFNTQ